MPLETPVHRRVFIESTRPWTFRFPPADTWRDSLGQSIESFFRHLQEAGLIERLSVEAVIAAQLTVPALQEELRQRGLKVGGNKPELVRRLIDNDPEWAAALHAADDRFNRTPAGQALAEKIEAEAQHEDDELESALLALIKRGDYRQAQADYLRWCSERGENANDIAADFDDHAARLAHKLPGIVAEHAILALLIGTWDPEFVVRLTDSRAAAYERDLLQYRQAPYAAGIRIEPSHSSECTCAVKHSGCYRLEDAPDYPFGACDNYPESGCMCFWTMVFKDDRVTEWKTPSHRHPKAGGYIERPLPPLTMESLRATGEILGASEAQIQVAAQNAGLLPVIPEPGVWSKIRRFFRL